MIGDMGINEIVYRCKDNPQLLDELVVNYAISELDYEKAKLIIADEQLCALAVEKYLAGIEEPKNETFKDVKFNSRRRRKMYKLKKVAALGMTMVAVLGVSFVMMGTTVDLSENIIVKMDPQAMSKKATAKDVKNFSNINYYNPDGDYDDMLTAFEAGGLSSEEAKSLVPTYDEKTAKHLSKLNIVPEISKQSEIKNGDELTIKYNYNKLYALTHNIRLKGTETKLKVDGLREEVDGSNYKTADMSLVKDICEQSLSDGILKQKQQESIFYIFSDPTPCYLAASKTGGTELIVYRSMYGEKMNQGQVWGDDVIYAVRLEGYIKDNKYVVSFKNHNTELEQLTTVDTSETMEQKPTEENYYITEVK